PFKSLSINSAVLFQAIVHSLLELIESPRRSGYADDRHIEMSTPNHPLQRRKNLLKSQITSHSVDNQRIRTLITHPNAPHFLRLRDTSRETHPSTPFVFSWIGRNSS